LSPIIEYFYQLVLHEGIRDPKNMNHFYLFPLFLSHTQVWKPSEGLIYFLLIIGAFLIAGVALSIFSFYEDCYWGDKAYRKFLKEGKKSSAKI